MTSPKTTTNIANLRIHPTPLDGDVDAGVSGETSGGSLIEDSLHAFCRTFGQVTGWPLQYELSDETDQRTDPLWSAPVNPGVGESPGHLMIGAKDVEPSHATSPIPRDLATALAGSVAPLIEELLRARTALSHREAELAAGVPIVSRSGETVHLVERLEAVLRGGAEAMGCQAAGLYLLDAATTELKLRSAWGLPAARLADPARPLATAMADLEALTGHAVVLEDASMVEFWRVPETCGSAICVPVATPTTLLGTLWLYCAAARPFSDQETNLVEILGGRLAIELEREMLVTEGSSASDIRRQIDAAARMQESQTPTTAPPWEDWDLAGWTAQSSNLGGNFHDWFTLPDGSFTFTVGDAQESDVEAALVGQTVRTAIRSHSVHEPSPEKTLALVNNTLWRGSAGDQFASVVLGMVDGDSGQIRFATSGQMAVVLLTSDGWKLLSDLEMPLGVQPKVSYELRHTEMAPGDVLVISSNGIHETARSLGYPLGETRFAEALAPDRDLCAKDLVKRIRDLTDVVPDASGFHDRSVLVVRRRI